MVGGTGMSLVCAHSAAEIGQRMSMILDLHVLQHVSVTVLSLNLRRLLNLSNR